MDEPFKFWRMLAWCGPLFLATYFGCWGLMGLCVPPLPATLTPEEMAAIFRENASMIRAGMVGAMTFAPAYMAWGLGISKLIETLEGRNRVMSVLQLWGAGLTVIPVYMCCIFILTATYRIETIEPTMIQLLYDMSWLTISVSYSVTTMQMIAMGVAFLHDKRAEPLMPKWLCWYSIWGGMMFIAEDLMPFFKSGPFARNGLLNFWIEYGIYFFYMIFVTWFMLKAIARLKKEHAAASGS